MPAQGSVSSKSVPRTLGKVTAVLLTAAMIVGTGLFTSLGAATSHAGSGILVAMLIGGLIALLTGLSAAQVGINRPEEGGAFIWLRDFDRPTISFIAGCAYLTEGIVGLGILALGFATYSAQLFPGLPIPLAASAALLAVGVVNFFGISSTSKILIGIFLINVVLLAIYVGFSIPHVKVNQLSPVLGTGVVGVLSGAATFFWTWDGFQRTAIMANEIRDPRKTIPVAIVGGITIAAIIYAIVAETTLGVLGAGAMGKTDAPIFLGAMRAIGGWAGWLILLSAWMTAFSEMLGDLLSTSRVGHAMGEAHELPRWFGIMHDRFKSPYRVIFALGIIGIVLVHVFPLRQLMPVASACTLVWYAATHYAALLLPEEKRFAPPVVSWVGLAGCAGLFVSLPWWSIVGSAGFLGLLTLMRRLTNRSSATQAGDKKP